MLLMLVGAALLAMPIRERAAKIAWSILLCFGIAYAVVLTAMPANLTNTNLVHHYLGAKYDIPYSQFYRVIYAALRRPQVGMHDLERPPAYVRADSAEQRAYYIGLLRSMGTSFDPHAPTETLHDQAVISGAVAREAAEILREHLDAADIARFEQDVRRAFFVERAETNLAVERRAIGDDYGFNGSPLYVATRKLDPTLHRAFDRWVGIMNLAWQIPAVVLAFWLLGLAVGLNATQRLAAVALVVSSWDLVGWALPGLILGGLWLPIGLACLLLRRRDHALAGGAVAWAGGVKLFPFILLGPSLVGLVRRPLRREHAVLVVSCIVSSAALVAASSVVRPTWPEYLSKIVVQFQSQAYILNSVSFNQLLMLAGVTETGVLHAIRLLLAAVVGILLWSAARGDDVQSLPRRALVMLALTGWFVDVWFNYYALAPLVLLTATASQHPRAAAAGVAAVAAAAALPEWDHVLLREQPSLWALKLLPYVAIPGWLAWRELAPCATRRARRLAVVVAAAALILMTGEAVRANLVKRYESSAIAALDRGDARAALRELERQLVLSPGNAVAVMNEGISLAMLRRDEEAEKSFARAVALAPSMVQARINHALILRARGRHDAAAAEIDAALAIAPHDVSALVTRARIALLRGRAEEARASLIRALELDPTNRVAAETFAAIR